MNESDERTGLEPRAVESASYGIEEDEPPGKPRRHPLWRDVPENQWNDWRWQSQNAIRSVRQLRHLLPFTPDELEAIGALEGQYKLAIPPYYFSLINPDDPNDPIRLQSVTSPLESRIGLRAGRPARGGQGLAGPRVDAPLSRPCLAGDDARLHHVLPLLHPQTRHHGPRRLGCHQPQRRADDRLRPRSFGNPRRHRLGRRSADLAGPQAAVLPGQPGHDSARRCHPHRHAGAGHAAAETVRRRADRPAGLGGQGLDSDALQPSTRNHAGSGPGLPGPVAGRHAGQQPHRPAQGRQRFSGNHAPACCAPCCASRCGPITCSTAIRSSGPAISAPRSGRAWRSWKGCAATCPAWAFRPTSWTAPTAAARFRSCPTTWSVPPTTPSSCGTTKGCWSATRPRTSPTPCSPPPRAASAPSCRETERPSCPKEPNAWRGAGCGC